MTGLEGLGNTEQAIADAGLTDMQIIESADVPSTPEENEDEVREFLKRVLEPLVQDYVKDETFVRSTQIKLARRNDNYWRNFQDMWWDEVSENWMPLSQAPDGFDSDDMIDTNIDDKFVNIYKAHGESIIAALSNGVPATKFFPEDADSPEDIATAQAYSKLAGYLRKNNKAKITLIRMLVTLYNEPFVAVYNYTDKNKKYGTVKKPITGFVSAKTIAKTCPECGNELEVNSEPPIEVEEGYSPSANAVSMDEEQAFCDQCEQFVNPFVDENENISEGEVGFEDAAKAKIIQEIYGVLNVGFAAYAKKPEDIPCLWLDTDMSVAQAKQKFPDIADEIVAVATEDDLTENKWARTNQDYRDSIPQYICAVRYVWLRDWAFNRVENEEDRNRLKEMFPEGVKVSLVNANLAEVEEENLDDHWTISQNPIYRFIAGDAIGSAVIPLQDVKNTVFRLSVDTIEHGISETFVESDVLDLERYSKEEIRPGTITPVKSNGQKSLGESFFQNKPANLSGELGVFDAALEKDTQFISGAFPSIYGGAMQGLGETLGAYQESRNQALQRLQLMWHLICSTWSEMEFKSINDYVKHLDYDIKQVEQTGTGYLNEWIRQAELKGKVSCIEPEANEAFPVSWAQKKAVIDQFMQLNNEYINNILGHPNNVTQIAQIYGMGDLYIPGEDDRNKQLYEIGELLKSAPMEGGIGPDGKPLLIPSVQPEVEIDDNEIHIQTCKSWLVSEAGQAAKMNNQGGYANVLAHLKMTQNMAMQFQLQEAQKMQMMQMSMMPQAADPNIQGPPPAEAEVK